MSNLSKDQLFAASDALQREAKRMEGLRASAEVLKDAGTLIALVDERSRQLATLHADIAAAEARLHLARDAAAKLDEEVAEERARSMKQAEANKVAAEAEARQIHADAVAQAESIVADAQAEAQRVNEQTRHAEIAGADALRELKEAREGVAAEIRSMSAELSDLNERLAHARAEAARIVQGVAQ